MEDALDFVRKVYQGAYKDGGVDKKTVNAYAKKYGEGIEEGWKKGGGKISLDFESDDAAMLRQLRSNVFHFSAAKNREEILQLTALLRDEKGKLRSWKDFKTSAVKVTEDFKVRYMKTEYDMAVNASYLAARWNSYADDDILEYQTAGDGRVRDSHRAMDGISLPKNHSFWKTFYPPNGWNCRCTVVVSSSKRITPNDKTYGDPDSVHKMFRSNFAEEGFIFPPNHPYFISPEGIKLTNSQRQALKFKRTGYDKGTVLIYDWLVEQNKNDLPDVLRFAHSYAKQKGGTVEALPVVEGDSVLRDWIMPGARKLKNPDFKINGYYADLKTLEKSSSLKYLRSKITSCLKQGDIAALQLRDNPKKETLLEAAYTKLNGERRLRAVIYQLGDGSILEINKENL